MESKYRYSMGVTQLGKLCDRFVTEGYRESKPLKDRVKEIAKIKIFDGISIGYPSEINEKNYREIVKLVSYCGLVISSIATSISSQRRWSRGALTSLDPSTRRQAIDIIKGGMDMAKEVKTDRIMFFLGQEGNDYPFGIDYSQAWDYLVIGLRECAKYRPEIKICIEYKRSEPRKNILIGSAAELILLLKEINMQNVGILLDMGHALFGRENPAQSLTLINRYKKLFHIHFNDNYGLEDDDLVVGSVHFLQYLEFMYWLEKIQYKDWLELDIFPYREDPLRAFEESVLFLHDMERILEKIGVEKLQGFIERRKPIEAFSFIRRNVFETI